VVVRIGYTQMCEQRGPKDLVRDVQQAEQAGFAFSVISDHFHPWLDEQGHSPYAWSVLGASAASTSTIELMTYVTCPILRYHPAVVAQKAATVSLLADGRFRLGLGAGEALNERVVGRGWPSADVRHAMLREAIEIIRELWGGGYVTYAGEYVSVESAKLFDLPDEPIPLGVAVSGPASCRIAGEMADLAIATEPNPTLMKLFRAAGGPGGSGGTGGAEGRGRAGGAGEAGGGGVGGGGVGGGGAGVDSRPGVAQLPVCHGSDPEKALLLARDQFRWSAAGWKVQAELPGPVNFDAYSQFVRTDDLAPKIPHGPDPAPYVEGVKQFVDAGFTEVALLQIGPDQDGFCDFYETTLGPALAEL
jgi:hypothetical protein